MIATSDLTYTYDGSTTKLTFPNLSCKPGKQLLILGDSGSGKTTLLHLLCGLLRADSGEVVVKENPLSRLSERELDNLRGQELGIVFQQSHFVQSLTVLENLSLPNLLASGGLNSEELEARIHELLGRLNVGHKAHSHPKSLSVGEQQRVSIARALIHKPSVVFADEPTSALDDNSTEAVISLLEEETKRAGAALIVVTHDSRLKSRYSDRIELKSNAR